MSLLPCCSVILSLLHQVVYIRQANILRKMERRGFVINWNNQKAESQVSEQAVIVRALRTLLTGTCLYISVCFK